jgi:organic radical activating enzyme
MALIEKRKMNYHQYYPVDIVNGPGTRCTLFVSGCVHECRLLQQKHLAGELRYAVYR